MPRPVGPEPLTFGALHACAGRQPRYERLGRSEYERLLGFDRAAVVVQRALHARTLRVLWRAHHYYVQNSFRRRGASVVCVSVVCVLPHRACLPAYTT